ncbi:PepSY domain-containing protein [Pelovirga terrestris]|nr:PepSY domain-containing protein [Pelovirga terrestris]
MARRSFRISRAIHKYLGLILGLYLTAMGASGLLLNHPAWIRSIDTPQSLVPADYSYQNWNRMLVRSGTISADGTWYLAGKAGIARSDDQGRSFTVVDEGFPPAAYDRDTAALVILNEDSADRTLLAATRSGLYQKHGNNPWAQVVLPGAPSSPRMVAVVETGERIVAFSETAAWQADPGSLNFAPVNLAVAEQDDATKVPLFRILHDIHNGAILGAPGKVLLDISAIILVILGFSGLVIWFVPWRNRKLPTRRRPPGSLFRWCWKYHLKLGIWIVVILMILAGSGIFLRPPLLLATVSHSLAADNPLLLFSPRSGGFGGKIQAATASSNGTIVISTENGLWHGPADLEEAFQRLQLPVPIHGMGVTVLEGMADGQLLIGSFSGLFVVEEHQGRVWRLRRPGLQESNPYQSNDLVSGVVMAGNRPYVRFDYHDGMLPMTAHQRSLPTMPAEIAAAAPMSLWHYLFEFHNGRIFEPWLGPWYLLIIPLSGIILLLLCLSGTYDWWCRRQKKKAETTT